MTDVCPCCGAHASASPHPELRFACDVCGGPRIPRLDPAIRFGAGAAALLRKADAARKARAGWRAAAIGSGILLPFSLLFLAAMALVFGASAVVLLIALFTVGPVAAFLAFALGRAAARGREIPPALDGAWLTAAADVARQTRDQVGGHLQAPGASAPVLAQKLGISEAQAEELVALLDANAAAGPRVRIAGDVWRSAGASARVPDDPGADVAMSEEEAALAERIEAAARAHSGADPGAGKP